MSNPNGEFVWAAWLAGVGASFAVLETISVNTGLFPTLSECMSKWMGLNPAKRYGDLAAIAFGTGGIALTVHLIRFTAAAEELIAEAEAAQIAHLNP